MIELKMYSRLCLVVALSALMVDCFSQSGQNKIDLAGTWRLALDSLSTGPAKLVFDKSIQLPGTLEDASIGEKVTLPPPVETTYRDLVRAMLVPSITPYVGKAWYSKTITIPSWAQNKTAILTLESIVWRSTVYVDGREIASEYSLSVPHRYDLTGFVNPGKHEIMICLDNSPQVNIRKGGSNGVRGDFKISFFDPSFIRNTSIYPDAEKKNIRVKVSGALKPGDEKIQFKIKEKESGKTIAESVLEINPSNEYSLNFKSEVSRWDEFNPRLYILESSLLKSGKLLQTHTDVFGFRKIESKGKQLVLNGTPVFLRGTLGGGGGTNPAEWERIYRMARAYGLNHFRFHSSCPPDAAFAVADRMGFYLQVECPIWSLTYGKDTSVVRYINEEAIRIIDEYGNHPSFLLMSTGNEMEGDFGIMNKMMSDLNAKEDRILFTTTSFTFQKDHGSYPEPADQFFLTQWTDDGWVRGQGYFDMEYPRFDKDYLDASAHIPVPLITHEVGQHTSYPDIKMIDKYSGSITRPVGLEAIKGELEKKGLLSLADDYVKASGELQVLLYKEEIERALKTYGISGFQLLSIKDGGYPTGMIGALWNQKEYIDSTEFQQFCSEVVPLAWFRKSVLSNSETLNFEVGVANFWQTMVNRNLICELSDNSGQIVEQKKLAIKEITSGKVGKYGRIEFNISKIQAARQLRLTVGIEGTEYINSWPIWVYPEKPTINDDQILITASFDEAERALNEGRKVLLSPPQERIKGNPGVFITVFWAPTHFEHWERVSEVGTMGLLVNPSHPAFSFFPTEFHSNWQWWDLCKNSQTMDYNNLDIQPLVRVIDNYYKNRNLTNLFEVKVGNGKLIFSSIDLISNLDERIEAKQLRNSMMQYMKSSQFDPKKNMTMQSLLQNFEVRENWVYPAAKYNVIKRSDPNYPAKITR